MTAINITHNGATYMLTDEASQSSYGEPVLVAADGTQFRGQEVVAVLSAEDDGFFSTPARPLLARDVANQGKHEAIAGEVFRAADATLAGYEALTPYGHATHALFARFMQQ